MKNKPKGFSLIEIMITMGIMGVASTAMVSFLKYSSSTMQYGQALSNYNRIFDETVKVAGSPDNLTLSYQVGGSKPGGKGNVYMQMCVLGPDAGYTCPKEALDPQKPVGYALLRNTDGAFTQGIMIAGDSTYSRKYKVSGEMCPEGVSADITCPIEAITTMSAACSAGKPIPCDVAGTFTMNVTVQVAKDTAGKTLTINGKPGFAPKTTNVTVPAISLTQDRVLKKCPPNQIMNGWKTDGEPLCDNMNVLCAIDEVYTGFTNGTVTCIKNTGQECPANQEGYGVLGRKALCRPKITRQCPFGYNQIGTYPDSSPICGNIHAGCFETAAVCPWGTFSVGSRYSEYQVCPNSGKKGGGGCYTQKNSINTCCNGR